MYLKCAFYWESNIQMKCYANESLQLKGFHICKKQSFEVNLEIYNDADPGFDLL